MARNVLVTGASGGIGAAVAAAFAREGCRVALGCHTGEDKALALAEELRGLGAAALVCKADVADEAEVAAMFRCVEKQFGGADVLVNCAGHAQQKMLCDVTADEFRRMMDVHVTGTFLCCKEALRGMVRQKDGCIINISSIWGQTGASCEVPYSAAKAAVIGLTKALAKEVGPSNIRVNCIAPGAVDTAMLEGFTPGELAALAADTPLGRLGTPKDVAGAAVFLASNAASFITGQVLGVNGGFVV